MNLEDFTHIVKHFKTKHQLRNVDIANLMDHSPTYWEHVVYGCRPTERFVQRLWKLMNDLDDPESAGILKRWWEAWSIYRAARRRPGIVVVDPREQARIAREERILARSSWIGKKMLYYPESREQVSRFPMNLLDPEDKDWQELVRYNRKLYNEFCAAGNAGMNFVPVEKVPEKGQQ